MYYLLLKGNEKTDKLEIVRRVEQEEYYLIVDYIKEENAKEENINEGIFYDLDEIFTKEDHKQSIEFNQKLIDVHKERLEELKELVEKTKKGYKENWEHIQKRYGIYYCDEPTTNKELLKVLQKQIDQYNWAINKEKERIKEHQESIEEILERERRYS